MGAPPVTKSLSGAPKNKRPDYWLTIANAPYRLGLVQLFVIELRTKINHSLRLQDSPEVN